MIKQARMFRPSPATAIAVAALVIGLAGAAVAEPGAGISKLSAKKVKNIANAQIAKQAPSLSVASATSADPRMFAHVTASGGVVEADSKNVADSNVTHINTSGDYCFDGLGPIRGATVTADADNPQAAILSAEFALGDDIVQCATGTQGYVHIIGDNGGTDPANAVDTAFFISFYN